jgi:hypothetical protein
VSKILITYAPKRNDGEYAVVVFRSPQSTLYLTLQEAKQLKDDLSRAIEEHCKVLEEKIKSIEDTLG